MGHHFLFVNVVKFCGLTDDIQNDLPTLSVVLSIRLINLYNFLLKCLFFFPLKLESEMIAPDL